MRRQLVSLILQTVRNIPTKMAIFKISTHMGPICLGIIPLITYRRFIMAGLFPTWFLVHASLIDGKEEESVQNKRKLIEKVDMLYEEMKYEEIHDLLYPDRLSNDDNILWRLARATYELGMTANSKEKAKSLGEEAFAYIKRALEINENNHNAHRWYAILLDVVAARNGLKERLLKSYESREHMEKAIEICNTDATSYYMLGVWCYSFADLPWYQRKVASILFASPPVSSFEEALPFFEKAEELQPNFYSQNLLMLGKTYLKLNEKEKAIIYLQKMKNYPLKTREDHEAFKEAVALLKSLNIK